MRAPGFWLRQVLTVITARLSEGWVGGIVRQFG
jgi:hypothetical protein